MNLSQNALKAVIRSLTPWATSVVIASVAHFGYHASPTLALALVVYIGAGLTVVLHGLEAKFPWVGVLLGWVGAPAYAPSLKAQLIAENTALKAQLAPVPAATVTVVAPELPVPTADVAVQADLTAPPA